VAVRTSEALVEGILLEAYDGTSDLTPHIESAALTVDLVEACGVRKGTPYSAELLEMMERWLAAWSYKMVVRDHDRVRSLNAETYFSGKTVVGLEANMWGQRAMTLDPYGCLEAVMAGGRRTATFAWGGKARADQQSYEDRNP
jgi:hypothetical protein